MRDDEGIERGGREGAKHEKGERDGRRMRERKGRGERD